MEVVQQCILTILGNDSVIRDTRDITLPGDHPSARSQDGQLLILGALNSLLSREVRVSSDIIFCKLIFTGLR